MSTQKTILVADDDDAILEALRLILTDAGYAVRALADGKEVSDLKTELPDLILLDIWMSGTDGRTICKKLKNQKTTKDIPVILISANKDVEDIALQAGADGFIAKPFEMKELLASVEKALAA